MVSPVRELLPAVEGLVVEPLLPMMAAQAAEADRTRSVDPAVIAAIKASDLIRLSAVRSIGGVEASVRAIADELEAISSACASAAWCLWNHLCVFHFSCGQLGPSNRDLLTNIVAAREWVTYPNGAGTALTGVRKGGEIELNGKITFASGARYGEWANVVFALEDGEGGKPAPHMSIVRLDDPGIRIDPSWKALSVRASATDDVYLEGVGFPESRLRPFRFDHPALLRDPEYPVLEHRYREDWVGLSVLWLGAQATGLAIAALDETVTEVTTRRAIFGAKMTERPGVQLNLGEAAASLAAARASWRQGCAETDGRIAAGVIPTEADYLRQQQYAMAAIRLAQEAMARIARTLGGNGLREEHPFERRFRDFQAMPLHIIAHPDRVTESTARFLLGIEAPGAGK